MVHAGWRTDPAHRHDLRYWDGRHWTPWVRDPAPASREANRRRHRPRARVVHQPSVEVCRARHHPAPRTRAGLFPLLMGAVGAVLALVVAPEMIAAVGGASTGSLELIDLVRLVAAGFLAVMAAWLGGAAILAGVTLSMRASSAVVRARARVAAGSGVIACLPLVFALSGS